MTDPKNNDSVSNDIPVSEDKQPTEQPDTEEHGGRKGPDPVRYGDWEHKGKCVDF